jgi:tRNA (cytidine/uridine-2'-O-)-methyltransferase
MLPPHHLKLVLMHPQIAPNTGNIARLCVASGTELHLVRPLGFVLSDRELKRSAMDYWPRLRLTVHDDQEGFFRAAGDSARMWYFSTKAQAPLWQAQFGQADWLVFGSETSGLPPQILDRDPSQCLQIPQASGERCLNLATAAAIGLYEALRQRQLHGNLHGNTQTDAALPQKPPT